MLHWWETATHPNTKIAGKCWTCIMQGAIIYKLSICGLIKESFTVREDYNCHLFWPVSFHYKMKCYPAASALYYDQWPVLPSHIRDCSVPGRFEIKWSSGRRCHTGSMGESRATVIGSEKRVCKWITDHLWSLNMDWVVDRRGQRGLAEEAWDLNDILDEKCWLAHLSCHYLPCNILCNFNCFCLSKACSHSIPWEALWRGDYCTWSGKLPLIMPLCSAAAHQNAIRCKSEGTYLRARWHTSIKVFQSLPFQCHALVFWTPSQYHRLCLATSTHCSSGNLTEIDQWCGHQGPPGCMLHRSTCWHHPTEGQSWLPDCMLLSTGCHFVRNLVFHWTGNPETELGGVCIHGINFAWCESDARNSIKGETPTHPMKPESNSFIFHHKQNVLHPFVKLAF